MQSSVEQMNRMNVGWTNLMAALGQPMDAVLGSAFSTIAKLLHWFAEGARGGGVLVMILGYITRAVFSLALSFVALLGASGALKIVGVVMHTSIGSALFSFKALGASIRDTTRLMFGISPGATVAAAGVGRLTWAVKGLAAASKALFLSPIGLLFGLLTFLPSIFGLFGFGEEKKSTEENELMKQNAAKQLEAAQKFGTASEAFGK